MCTIVGNVYVQSLTKIRLPNKADSTIRLQILTKNETADTVDNNLQGLPSLVIFGYSNIVKIVIELRPITNENWGYIDQTGE